MAFRLTNDEKRGVCLLGASPCNVSALALIPFSLLYLVQYTLFYTLRDILPSSYYYSRSFLPRKVAVSAVMSENTVCSP